MAWRIMLATGAVCACVAMSSPATASDHDWSRSWKAPGWARRPPIRFARRYEAEVTAVDHRGVLSMRVIRGRHLRPGSVRKVRLDCVRWPDPQKQETLYRVATVAARHILLHRHFFVWEFPRKGDEQVAQARLIMMGRYGSLIPINMVFLRETVVGCRWD